MRRLRFLVITMIAWFFFFFNIERISAPINIASFVYVFAPLVAVAIVLIPAFYHRPVFWMVLVFLPLYFLIKWQLGYPIGGTNLPLTVTEVTAIIITMSLTRQIMARAAALQETISRLTLGHLRTSVQFADGQGTIYREIRRARQHNRSVGLLSIGAVPSSVAFSLNRFSREAQAAIIRRYVEARVADLLLEELEDYNIVTQRNDHFVALLPEAEEDDVAGIVERLHKAAEEKLGIQLKIGLASFPAEAVTFEQLLATAEKRMAEQPASTPPQPSFSTQVPEQAISS